MWFKFKNVATIIIETFHLLLITILLGNPFNVKQIDDIVVMASTAKLTLATIIANSSGGGNGGISGVLKQHHTSHFPHQHNQHQHQYPQQQYTIAVAAASASAVTATAATTSITSATSLSTTGMPAMASASASASSLNASLFVLQASGSANNLYNSTFAQVIDRNGKYDGKTNFLCHQHTISLPSNT